MNKGWRSMAVVVGLFTALAVAMVWGLSLRLQAQLREQMLDQAEARAGQLADAMAGQTQSYARLLDRALLDLREQWPREPGAFAQAVDVALAPVAARAGFARVGAERPGGGDLQQPGHAAGHVHGRPAALPAAARRR